jgi:hypothetical protein
MTDDHQDLTALRQRSASAARLFDIRRIIGGLFSVYGVILVVAGLTDSDAARRQAQGIAINLWTGAAMLLVGLAFLLWLRLSPTPPPPTQQHDETRDGDRDGDGTEDRVAPGSR